MRKSMKLVAVGAAIAAVLLAGAELFTYRVRSNIESLVARCNDEDRMEAKGPNPYPGSMVCDPEELVGVKATGDGVQAKIVYERQRLTNTSLLHYLALSVFIISAAPALWYFLLQRIRELREALIGK